MENIEKKKHLEIFIVLGLGYIFGLVLVIMSFWSRVFIRFKGIYERMGVSNVAEFSPWLLFGIFIMVIAVTQFLAYKFWPKVENPKKSYIKLAIVSPGDIFIIGLTLSAFIFLALAPVFDFSK